jgi:hypothetical protein
MSKIAVAGNASGTGTLTIAAPNTNSDRTLTLPDVTATVITDSAGVLNIGSGQVYKDGSGNVGIGTSSPLTGLSLSRSGTQWTNNSANTYPVPAGRTFVQMEAVAAQANWFGFTGAYGATSGSANLLLQVNLNNTSQQAGNYIASEAQSATAADLTFGKMVAGATTGANSAKSEQMRITSAGDVGIGTSSPISNGGYGGLTLNGTNGALFSMMTNGTESSRIASLGDVTSIQCKASTGYISFVQGVSGGSERMRLDSSGNLGLGVTPSAWNTGYKVFAVGGTNGNDQVGGIASGSGITIVSTNYYRSTAPSDLYAGTGYAMQYKQISGEHQFFTAPSGTAGNAISFTQAMTLTATGRLGIGTTGPATTLDARGDACLGTNLYLGADTVFQEQRLSVIGTTSGSTGLAFSQWTGSAYTERARLDSSGNLLVGTTSASSPFDGCKIAIDANSSDGIRLRSAGVAMRFIATSTSTFVGSITTTASATAYNTSSDYRLKEDWVAVADASTRVNALKPVNFAWKVDGTRVDGFLAHEVAEVVPEAITGEKDAVDAEGKPVYQGIDQSKLVPLLTAALQEALARIETLEADVATLKGAA